MTARISISSSRPTSPSWASTSSRAAAQRADSIQRALARVKPDIDFVAVHDAARPCLADEWITHVFEAAEKSGAAILAIPVAARSSASARITRSSKPSRAMDLWEAQTPQVFRRQLLLGSLCQAGRLSCHRRCATCRTDRPRSDDRPRLADQPENHHARRPAAGRTRRSRRCPSPSSPAPPIPSPTTICGDSAENRLRMTLDIYSDLNWRGLIHQTTDDAALPAGWPLSRARSTSASIRRPTACTSAT